MKSSTTFKVETGFYTMDKEGRLTKHIEQIAKGKRVKLTVTLRTES